MESMTCFFAGHRDAPETLRPLLDAAIERHITAYHVGTFIAGHYGTFDRMALGALGRAKMRHPEIVTMMLLPYHPGERPIELPTGLDGTFYPEGMEKVPRSFAIVRANRYMIRTSEYLICYDRGLIGNTAELVAAARRREKKGLMRVENLADQL